MAYFGSHLVPRSYLGRHQVTKDFGRHLVLALAFTFSKKIVLKRQFDNDSEL